MSYRYINLGFVFEVHRSFHFTHLRVRRCAHHGVCWFPIEFQLYSTLYVQSGPAAPPFRSVLTCAFSVQSNKSLWHFTGQHRPFKDVRGSWFRWPMKDKTGAPKIGEKVSRDSLISLMHDLKGQCHEIFCVWFFSHELVSPPPQSIPFRLFRIFSKIRGDNRESRCTTGINDTGGKFATGISDTGGKFLHHFR